MRRPLKSKETNRKSSKKSRNEKSRISKKKKIMSSSSNGRDTNSEPGNQEKILPTVRRYSADESQDRLKEILWEMIELLERIIVQTQRGKPAKTAAPEFLQLVRENQSQITHLNTYKDQTT